VGRSTVVYATAVAAANSISIAEDLPPPQHRVSFYTLDAKRNLNLSTQWAVGAPVLDPLLRR
jgi:hypothetical protein